ncbi:MAG: acetyl-CoA C-acetyltransferase [Pseudobdellovibrio sp.]
MKNRKVFIVGGTRIPFVKSMTTYFEIETQKLMTDVLQNLVQKYSLQGRRVGDVATGGVMLGTGNWNLSRECVLGTELDPTTPAYNVQRACGTSLDTTSQLALRIYSGQIESAIAGGVDSNSDLPIQISKSFRRKLLELNRQKDLMGRLKVISQFRPSDLKPHLPEVREPRTGLSMGEHCEKMVQEWNITRAEQDQLAYESHQKASRAYDEGFFSDLVMNYQGLSKDAFVRKDTTIEKLAKLKPAFDFTGKGTLTAGNSTPFTDGASAVLLASEEECARQKWTPLARFVDSESGAVDYVHGEGLLMAPTTAVARLLKRNNLTLQDFDFYEIHEAFAGQVLCTLKAWESPDYCAKKGIGDPLGSIDRNKLNVKGGSLALGHPFGATGTRIVASLAKILSTKPKSRGLISICTAGGMGVTAILESVN